MPDLGVHPGGITAVDLRGYAHHAAFRGREIVLFEALLTAERWLLLP